MARATHERSPQSNAEPLRTSAAGTANYIYNNNAQQTRWINPRSNRNNRYDERFIPARSKINAVKDTAHLNFKFPPFPSLEF